VEEALSSVPTDVKLPKAGNPGTEAARKAIMDCIQDSCGAVLSDALSVQAKHSADFMGSDPCRKGVIGADCAKVMNV